MRKWIASAGLAVLVFLSVPSSFAKAPATKEGPGTIIIVFKDGHRQVFNLADVARVEFGGATVAASASANPSGPPRGRFIGKWECGDGNGGTFYITLKEDGGAYRSIGDVRGHWEYVNGEAHVTWNDGALDAIRRVGSRYRKFAYMAGKSFTDKPANETDAKNTSPEPI